MDITASSPFLCAGENGSRTLSLHLEQSLAENKNVRLAFITPAGRALLSPSLEVSGGECDYPVPFEVLDRYGKLKAQIMLTDENGYCLKSDIFCFEVYPGIDEQSAVLENGELITLPQVNERLCAVENYIDGLEPYVLPTASADVKGGVKVGANLSIDGSGVLSATTSAIGRYIVDVGYEYGGPDEPFTDLTISQAAAAAIPSHVNNGEEVVLRLTAPGVSDVYYAELWGHNGYGVYNFRLWDGSGLFDVFVYTSDGTVMIIQKG